MILAGHGRVAAAKLAGLDQAPCIRVGTMTAAEKRAYALADNAIALKSEWNRDLLTEELQGLLEEGFEMELTGFDQAELDQLLVDSSEASPKRDRADPDDTPELPSPEQAVTKLGDVWKLGRHRVINGNAKDPAALAALMGSEKADAVFTDPPWNLQVDGHVSGKGRVRHREFVEASGEMSREAFATFLLASMDTAAQACRPGAILFVCMD